MTRNTFTFFVLFLLGTKLFSQLTYNYDLRQDVTDPYLFSLNAVSNETVANTTYVNSTFMILVDAGIPINLTNDSMGEWQQTGFLSALQLTSWGVGDGSKDFYAFGSTPGSVAISNSDFELVSFSIGGSPLSGSIEILGNTHPVITGIENAGFDAQTVFNVDYNDGLGTLNVYGLYTGVTTYSFDKVLANVPEKNQGFSIAPNPNKGIFVLSTQRHMDGLSLNFFDITGRMVYKITDPDTLGVSSRIDVSHLPSGAYMVQIQTALDSGVAKIVLQ